MSVLCITYQWDRLTAIFIAKTFKFNFFNTDPFLFFPKQKQTCLFRCVQIAKMLTGLQLSASGRLPKISLCWTPDKGQLTFEGEYAWIPCYHLRLAKSSLDWGVMLPVFPFYHIVRWLVLINLVPVCGEGCIHYELLGFLTWNQVFVLYLKLMPNKKIHNYFFPFTQYPT